MLFWFGPVSGLFPWPGLLPRLELLRLFFLFLDVLSPAVGGGAFGAAWAGGLFGLDGLAGWSLRSFTGGAGAGAGASTACMSEPALISLNFIPDILAWLVPALPV